MALSNPAAMANELEPTLTNTHSQVSEYKIEQSPRPVVTAWNAEHPRAFLVALHGFGLHKGSFQQFAVAMQERDISTYALDVRGFGGWASNKNEELSFDKTFDDLTLLISSIHRNYPGKPIFLIGESMGGAIALEYSAQHSDLLDGVISAVPASERFAKFRTAVALGTSYVLTGGHNLSLNHALVDRVFNDKQLKQNWESDPDSKLSFKLGDLLKLTHFMKQAQHSAARIHSLPVLMVQGLHDRLVRPQATERIFHSLRTDDKQLIEVEKGEHLTFEDGQFDNKFVSQVDHWVSDHTETAILTASSAH